MKTTTIIIIIICTQWMYAQSDVAMLSAEYMNSIRPKPEIPTVDWSNTKEFLLTNSLLQEILRSPQSFQSSELSNSGEWHRSFYDTADHRTEVLFDPSGNVVYAREKIRNYTLPIDLRKQILKDNLPFSISEVHCTIIYSERTGIKKQFKVLLIDGKRKKRIHLSVSS